MSLNMNEVVGTHDLLFVVLDTLRYDVACECLAQGRTPNLQALLPDGKWEARHTPGNFTLAAHQAFFAGFLPTPIRPGRHPRLLAAKFQGSETTTSKTFVFDAPDFVTGLRETGYHTICVGGVGFFNRLTALGSVLPSLFDESHWSRDMGVTDASSTEKQAALAEERVRLVPDDKRVFLFVNISAIHQPNCIFVPGAARDNLETHAAALAYVDRHIPRFCRALQARAPVFCIFCSDHGTAYGEDGYHGHRLSHPVVWTVPYAHFVLPRQGGDA